MAPFEGDGTGGTTGNPPGGTQPTGTTGGATNNVPPPVFSLTPGKAHQGIIDLTSRAGAILYKSATTKLEEELYDCHPDGFYQFMKSLKVRADAFGWTDIGGICWVPISAHNLANKKNILNDYGMLTLERVTEHELTYVHSKTRNAQDDRMLYECLIASLTIEGKAKLNVHEEEYIIGQPGANKLPSGLCLLKVLIRESHLDSNATTGMIRTKLSNLDIELMQNGNDILKFNSHVQVLLDQLAARGETTEDLLTNLFKAYATCSDHTFVKYIADHQTKWEDGESLSAHQLMAKAANKYKILKTKELWEAPTAQDEKIMAMEAKLNSYFKKDGKDKRKRKGDGGDKKDKIKRQKPGGDKGKGKGKGKKQKKELPHWHFVRPADGELKKPKMWEGKKWHWCSKETGGKCDGQYRIHHPKQCKGTAKKRVSFESKTPASEHNEKVVIKEALIDEEMEELEGGYMSED